MKWIICAAAILFASCGQEGTKPTTIEGIKRDIYVDSVVKATMKRAHDDIHRDRIVRSDTASPLSIVKASLVTDEYGSTDVVVKVKNTSSKTIDAVVIGWVLTDNFGDDADEYNSGGKAQNILKPGKIDIYRWALYRTAATHVKAYVSRIHFTDGSLWEN